MTLCELLHSGPTIVGYRRIQSRDDNDSPVVYYEGIVNEESELTPYMEREVTYMASIPSIPPCLVIELARE